MIKEPNSLTIKRLRVLWWQQWKDAFGLNGGMNWVDIDWIGLKTEAARKADEKFQQRINVYLDKLSQIGREPHVY